MSVIKHPTLSALDEPPPMYLRTESPAFQLALIATLMAIALSSFALGFIPLYEVARWGELPPAVSALLPIVLDLGSVAAALAALVRRARGQAAGFELAMLAMLAAISVAAQVVHAHEIGAGGWNLQTILIAVVLGAAPVVTLSASHIALRALTEPPKARRRPQPRALASSRAPAPPTKPTAAAPQPANPKPAAPKATGPSPAREPDESDVAYALRLHRQHGVPQRSAAVAAGTTRSKLETALKQGAAA